MRAVATLLLAAALAGAAGTRAADGPPSADEQAAIDAIAKLGGKGEIDPDLPPPARVIARIDRPTDAKLAALKKLPAVGALDIAECAAVTDKGWGSLKDLPALRKVVLTKSGLTDVEFSALCNCKQLRVLSVSDAGLTDAGLKALAKVKYLESLDLSGNRKVTDKGMPAVVAAERLDELYLNNTAITDKGLKALKPLEGLRRLSVVSTAVTGDAAEAFADEMPNLRKVQR